MGFPTVTLFPSETLGNSHFLAKNKAPYEALPLYAMALLKSNKSTCAISIYVV